MFNKEPIVMLYAKYPQQNRIPFKHAKPIKKGNSHCRVSSMVELTLRKNMSAWSESWRGLDRLALYNYQIKVDYIIFSEAKVIQPCDYCNN